MQSAEEPSIFLPTSPALVEVNFLGLDATIHDPSETYVLDDLERMRARARAVRAHARIRTWKYRQRNLAAGVWFRLRRVLADAEAAYAISDEEAGRLLDEGYECVACGREVAPAKTIVFVDAQRLDRLESRRPIRVDLGPAFLTAPAVALVRFDEKDASARPAEARR
ncbi:MAG: hypothetical protein ACRD3C_02025 [Vicinamibacterales bacterium]